MPPFSQLRMCCICDRLRLSLPIHSRLPLFHQLSASFLTNIAPFTHDTAVPSGSMQIYGKLSSAYSQVPQIAFCTSHGFHRLGYSLSSSTNLLYDRARIVEGRRPKVRHHTTTTSGASSTFTSRKSCLIGTPSAPGQLHHRPILHGHAD